MLKRFGAAVALALAALITPALAGHTPLSFACTPGPGGCYSSYSTSYSVSNSGGLGEESVSWSVNVNTGAIQITSLSEYTLGGWVFQTCGQNASGAGYAQTFCEFRDSYNGVYYFLYIKEYSGGSSTKWYVTA